MLPEEFQQRFWPFECLPPEFQTDQHRREGQFLQKAYEEGFRPFTYGAGNYGATAPSGRGGDIVVRGRTRWEIVLFENERRVWSAFVRNFSVAAEALLEWLRGASVDSIAASVEETKAAEQ